MKNMSTLSFFMVSLFVTTFVSCNESASTASAEVHDSATVKYDGFPDQATYGRHLVEITGCGDCHTPKQMTSMGPVADTTMLLSGHPASMPSPAINRKEAESKGLAATNDMTAWVGPWGISYAANLTPHETGIGNWTEAQFFRCMREGKFKGLASGRPLLPPMPWEHFANMKDEELKAIFMYLKSIKPIDNVVTPPAPPVTSHH